MNFKAIALMLLAIIFSGSLFGQPKTQIRLSANEVIDLIRLNVKCPWAAETVDTFKTGNPNDVVSGIAVCMFADMQVLRKAVSARCNLIITHEPTFYNHSDETKSFEADPVFQDKMKYIRDNNLIIWRFHDHWHRTMPDGIYAGMAEKLGWADHKTDNSMVHFKFENQKLSDFVSRLKRTFPGNKFRVVGRPDMILANVALSVGAPGAASQIRLLNEKNTDVLVAGEAPEWETYQYVYDAQLQGKNKAVIFLGHALSESAGMNYCSKWLKGFIPKEIKIQYFESGSSFTTY